MVSPLIYRGRTPQPVEVPTACVQTHTEDPPKNSQKTIQTLPTYHARKMAPICVVDEAADAW